MSREAFAETARSNTMDMVTNMGEDMKNQLRQTLSDNLANGGGMRDAAQSMADQVEGMSNSRASTIARTETTRAKNLGNCYKYQDKGYQSYTVDSTGDACDECVDFYSNMVFSIDDIDSLPPFHPNCMCVAVFHTETPEEYADANGYDVYDSGDSEASPDETPTDDTTSNDNQNSSDNGLEDIMNTLSNIPSDTLTDVVSQIAPDVTGASGDLASADLSESMQEYLDDPTGFEAKYPARTDVVKALLNKMLQNQTANTGG